MPKAESSPVIMISMAFEPPYLGQRDLVLVGKEIDCPRPDTAACRDEYDLISRFASIIREYDPDILAGYNSNEFDFPYLQERARQRHVDVRSAGTAAPGTYGGSQAAQMSQSQDGWLWTFCRSSAPHTASSSTH